ncbi:MAG: type VI secretion system protein TssA [Polyangiaceae bacterium]
MSVEDVINAAKERIESLAAPINGGVGEDCQYDELFDAIGVEIAKLTAVEGGKIEWGTVGNNAEELLNEKTKDFRLGLFYAMGKAHTAGLQGLLDGLVLVKELTDRYWDTMYPNLKRPKTRGNAVGTFSDVVGPHIMNLNPGPKDRDLCLAIDQMQKAVDSDLSSRLGEAYGGFSKFREGFRSVLSRAPAAPAPPPPPPPPPSEAAPVTTYESSEPAVYTPEPSEAAVYYGEPTAGPSADAIVDLGSALETLATLTPLFVKAAAVVRGADPVNPLGYRFNRIAHFAVLGGEPPNENGRTAIPAPTDPGLADLAAASDWASLLTAAEDCVAASPLWLDAHRWVVTALENAGEDFARARDVVVRDLGMLLALAPKLPEMSFEDGTPFASADTKAWIPTVAAGGGGGARNPMDKAIDDARKAVSEGDVPRAIATLMRAVNASSVPSLKFKGRLEIARICLDGGIAELAASQLDVLERVSETHSLPDWDPTTAADLYALLYRARRGPYGASEDPAMRAKLATTFERLCLLDPVAALKSTQTE